MVKTSKLFVKETATPALVRKVRSWNTPPRLILYKYSLCIICTFLVKCTKMRRCSKILLTFLLLWSGQKWGHFYSIEVDTFQTLGTSPLGITVKKSTIPHSGAMMDLFAARYIGNGVVF